MVSACQKLIHELQRGLSLSVELCGALGEMGGNSEWTVCQGADGLGKAQRTSAAAFCEKQTKTKQDPEILFLIYSA